MRRSPERDQRGAIIDSLAPSALFKSAAGEAAYMKAYEETLSLWDVPYTSSFVDTEFGRTHVLQAGPASAPALVLLHGFGFGAGMWYPNVKAWSANHRVIAVDVVGEFNRTITSRSLGAKQHYVEWLSQVLDGLDVREAVFVGHSNGGWHALNFAIRRPEKVAGLALLAPAASFLNFSWQFPVRLITINVIRTRQTIIEFFGKWMLAKGNEIEPHLFEQFYQGIMHFGWKHKIVRPSRFSREELAAVSAPGLFLVGDQEVIYSTEKAVRKVRELRPDFEVDVIPGAGHGLSVEQPEIVNARVLEFLRTLNLAASDSATL
ncbi:alpha/beta fold hydrolase [Ruicaihuangia caeni]|uniref:Alpha/beta hydrolase n=1 Tax=Ruicaihuangia caeni TaxID=3042517 RepID=A0AAW6T7U3_9MICO|nr:alpha/beta hydrolase [Klugiella sp. YN-L-19]MDI2099166.1 alpha/beta hydrolase [Klugiella sp. YN-L-19]